MPKRDIGEEILQAIEDIKKESFKLDKTLNRADPDEVLRGAKKPKPLTFGDLKSIIEKSDANDDDRIFARYCDETGEWKDVHINTLVICSGVLR